MLEVITDNLDVWTTAQKQKKAVGRGRAKKDESYGIKKLRELILELAVRGKLVPQDVSDEPASVLLERIAKEKQRLVEEGRVKKQKSFPDINENEKYSDLPKGWSFTRLGEVLNVLNGRAYKKHEMLQEGTPLLRVGNLFTSNEWYYSDLKLESSKYIETGDLIYAWSASFGPFIWNNGKVIYHYHIWKLDLYAPNYLSKYFLLHFLMEKTQEIKASGNGIAMIHMTKERMEKLVLLLPPLAEQHRIVAKVDELMALCDQLEQQQADHQTTHQTLVETLLNGLLESVKSQAKSEVNDQQSTADYFNQLIAEHFDTLFTTEQSIDQLKQTILQLAVMGKLVPQDPNDEPASVLLEKIAEEKTRLIQAGKIKKQKALPEIGVGEKPFGLPNGWKWVCFQKLFEELKYGTSKRSDYNTVGKPVLRIPNVVKGYVDSADLKFAALDEKEANNLKLKEGDLLIIRSNGSLSIVGRTTVVDSLHINFMYAGYLVRARMNTGFINPYFVKLLFDSKLVREQIELPIRTTSGVKNINSTEISGLLIPVAPHKEQHRIVTKVNQLLTLCDSLKANLNQSQTTQTHLADAIVKQAVN